MMEEFLVDYLAWYPWEKDPDMGPDRLVTVRFVAMSKEDALHLAKAKIPEVIAAYCDEGDEVTEEHITIEVKSWAAWGNTLDAAWDAICNSTTGTTEEA